MKTILLRVFILTICVSPCADLWAYSGGDGTSGNPYLISSKADLLELRVDTGNWDRHFLMTTNIDLAGEVFTDAVVAPSPDGGSRNSFTGCFNGNGHEIRNLTITGNANYVGLFGGLCAASVSNLGVVDCAITGSNYVGSISGWSSIVSINNCYSSGTVSGHDYVGGVQGGYQDYISLSQSCFSGEVSGHDYVGGLCGWFDDGTITNCYAVGSVSGNNYVAGFCGYNAGEIRNCYAACRNDASGGFYMGGFCAGNDGSITNCFWDYNRSGLPGTIGWGTAATTAEMQTQSTFSSVGWDFSSTWEMYGYPTLQGLNEPLYGLSVSNGTGAGVYTEWTLVNISAVSPIPDYSFASWTVEPQVYSNDIVDASASSTAFLMPATGVTLTAYFNLYSGGDGTTHNPYLIANKADLLVMAGRTNDYDKCFKMMADIDVATESFTTAVIASGLHVSNSFQGTSFSGIFEGNGHVISNLTITGSNDYVGLFGRLDQSEVRSLSIVNCTISGGSYVGGLYGASGQAVIEKCYYSGSISGNLFVGGIGGMNLFEAINNCYVTGNITGNMAVGGISGLTGSGTISRCYSKADISCNSDVGAGLCGCNFAQIFKCYSSGNVDCSGPHTGGLIADNYGSVSASFWDTETSGMTNSAGGIGKTTAEMQTESTFTAAGWDFVDTWMMDGYPQFQWVAADNAYKAWANYWGIPTDERGYEEDPAGDQIPNLLKYAIGLDPMAVCSFMDVMELFAETNKVYITYHKSKQAEYVDLYPEQTDSLMLPDWTGTGFDITKIDETSSNETWKAKLLTNSAVTFIRLEAQ